MSALFGKFGRKNDGEFTCQAATLNPCEPLIIDYSLLITITLISPLLRQSSNKSRLQTTLHQMQGRDSHLQCRPVLPTCQAVWWEYFVCVFLLAFYWSWQL